MRPGDNRDVGDQTQEPAIHYRDKAGEIARAAGLTRSAGVRLELLQIATAFKRMAEHFDVANRLMRSTREIWPRMQR